MRETAHALLTPHQVQPGNTQGPSVLELMDDPSNKAHMIASSWVVTEMLPIGQRTPAGPERMINHAILTEGDFVDVGISFGIVVKKHQISIHLTIVHISQLMKAKDVSKVCTLNRPILVVCSTLQRYSNTAELR